MEHAHDFDRGERAQDQNQLVAQYRGLDIFSSFASYYAYHGNEIAADDADSIEDAQAQIDAYLDDVNCEE